MINKWLFLILGSIAILPSKAQPTGSSYLRDLQVFDSINTSIPYLISANKSHIEANYEAAILELEKGIKTSLIQKDSIALLCAYKQLGNNYKRLGLFDQTLDNYTKGLELSKKLQSQAHITSFSNSIGIYFFVIGDIKTAEKYYLKALKTREYYNDKIGLISSYNNVGVINKVHKNPKEALNYYFKSLAIIKSEKLDSSKYIHIFSNIGNAYKDLLNYDKARNYLNQAYQISLASGSKYYQASSLHNLGSSYQHEKNPKKAIAFLLRSYKISESIQTPKLIMKSSEELSQAYEAEGDLKNALMYAQQHFKLKEEMLEQKLNKKFAFMQVKYESSEKDKKIAILENQTALEEFKLKMLIIGIVLLLVSGIVTINRQRKLIKKEKQLLQLEINSKNQLENELDYKTNELTNFALHIAQRNDFIRDVKSDLVKVSSSISDTIPFERTKKILVKLNQFANNSKDLEHFNKKLENINHDFIKRLKKNFSNLTENELQLCIYLRLRLSSKEIASITNITSKSVDMNRYRLRKKLNLNEKIDFYTYIQNV